MQGPLIETLARQGVSRRTFLKYCATLASMMALPPSAGLAMAGHAAAQVTLYENEGFQGRSFTTSEQISNLGRTIVARAMAARWHWPPLSSCG